MIDFALLFLAGGGLALGAGAAQIGGPVSWNWRPRAGSIQHRLRCLPRGAPSAGVRAAGLALLASLLAGGTLTAYAAAPSAPERLAVQAAGVVGSGDQLALKLKAPDGDRMLKIGETYADGWMLKALTPTQATLAKAGEIREIGLNPTGVVASAAPAAPPSTVSLSGLPNAAAIQAYIDAADPATLQILKKYSQLLAPEEARRLAAYDSMLRDELARRMAADSSVRAMVIRADDQRAILGEAGFADYWALQQKSQDAQREQTIAELAARPVTGPTSFYVPAGASNTDAAAAKGIDFRGPWSNSSPDAQGGHTVTLMGGTAEAYAALPAVPIRPESTLMGIYPPVARPSAAGGPL